MRSRPSAAATPWYAQPGDESSDRVRVRLIDASGRATEAVEVPRVKLSEDQWQKALTPEQYDITRGKGTERPFCGVFHDNHQDGVYFCVGCGLPLFASKTKFDSGTGWPSFFQPVAGENVVGHQDRSHGMVRTEVVCARCGGHLGHVFEDGPAPTFLRFCINSDALSFVASDKLTTLTPAALRFPDGTAGR